MFKNPTGFWNNDAKPRRIYKYCTVIKAVLCLWILDIILYSYLYYNRLVKQLSPEERKQFELEGVTPMTDEELSESVSYRLARKADGLIYLLIIPKILVVVSLTAFYDFSHDRMVNIKDPEFYSCLVANNILTFMPVHAPYCYGMPLYRKAYVPNFWEEEQFNKVKRKCYLSLFRDAGSCSRHLYDLNVKNEYQEGIRFINRWKKTLINNKSHPRYCYSYFEISDFYNKAGYPEKSEEYQQLYEGCREE